jgi:hypothetical protein
MRRCHLFVSNFLGMLLPVFNSLGNKSSDCGVSHGGNQICAKCKPAKDIPAGEAAYFPKMIQGKPKRRIPSADPSASLRIKYEITFATANASSTEPNTTKFNFREARFIPGRDYWDGGVGVWVEGVFGGDELGGAERLAFF